MVYLTTKRLVLRDLREEDLADHHRLISDPEVMYYLPEIHTASEDASRENLDFAVREAAVEPRKYCFLCLQTRDGAFVGEMGYTVNAFTPVGKLVGVGYFLLKEHWGKGYASEALRELMRFAFEEDGVVRLSTGCIKENIASEQVMRRCGMVKEAELKRFVWHDGHLKDRVEYRLLKEEWEISQDRR